MKTIKNTLKAIGRFISLLSGCDGIARRDAVDNGLCDFGGQGRNKYGR